MHMNNMVHELFEELEAFDPKWTEHYPTIEAAAAAAEVFGMYAQWLQTDEGKAYLSKVRSVPDYAGAAQRMREANERFEEASQ